MGDVNDLRRKRKEAATAMRAAAEGLSALEAKEGASDEELGQATAAFDAAQAAFDAANRSVLRAEAVEAATAAAAKGDEDVQGASAAGGDTVPARAADPAHKGVAAGLMVAALANAKGDRDRAATALESAGHSGISAALSGATESAGGVTIPRPTAAEFIELLRPLTTVRASGARVIPMPAGELRHARQATSSTASYAAENAPIIESEPSFDNVDQSFKKLTALVPVGNSLLRHSGIAMGQLVRDDMLREMSLKEDLAFLRYDGTGSAPKGLRHWSTTWNAGPVANDAATVEAALRAMVSRVEDANVAMRSPGWIMRAGTKNFLASLREGAGGFYIFPSIRDAGTLLGFPIRTTSQIPDNLGVGADECEVYFADFDEVMIGDSMSITVSTSGEATFVDAGGNVVSAFQRDLTLMRTISEHDLAPRHDEAITGLNGKGWTL